MGGQLRFSAVVFSAVVFSAVVFSAATSSAIPAACCSFGELPRCCNVRRFLTLDGFLADCTAPVPAVAPTVAGRSNELWRAGSSGGLGFLGGWTLFLRAPPWCTSALVRVRVRAPARSDAALATAASTALGAACRSASAVSSAELRRSPPISAVISADALAALSTAALSTAALSTAALAAGATVWPAASASSARAVHRSEPEL